MFKYISEILSQFTMKQKMKALIVLVITITVISLGSTYLKEVNKSSSELKEQIEAQRQMISYQQTDLNQLQKKVRELNSLIIQNDIACTDSTLAIEQYYSKKLIEQQRYVTQTIEQVKQLLMSGRQRQVYNIKMDEPVVDDDHPRIVKSLPDEPEASSGVVDEAIFMLDNMKDKMKKKK